MGLWDRYKQFVLRNPRVASEAHMSLSGMAYLVLDLNSTLQFESVRSAEHLLELVNKRILEESAGGPPPHRAGWLPLLLKVVSIVELPVEIYALSRFPRAHFPFIFSVEAAKTLVKLWRLWRTRRMRIRFESQAPDADRPSSGPGGRPLGAAHPMRRRASAAQIVAQPRLTPLRLVGELFHTLRPIAYASMLWRFGFQSWYPLLAALGMDAAGVVLSRDVSSPTPSRLENAELSSRIRGVANYAFRDPLFARFIRPHAERLRLFLESKRNASVVERMVYGLVRGILEYVLNLQRHYFYSADSS